MALASARLLCGEGVALPGDDRLRVYLLISTLLLLTVLGRALLRRGSPAQLMRVASADPAVRQTLPMLLCAFLCSAGAVWLMPWATVLAKGNGRSLLTGIVFGALPAIGVLYALARSRTT